MLLEKHGSIEDEWDRTATKFQKEERLITDFIQRNDHAKFQLW